MLGTLSWGPTFLCSHLQGAQRKSSSLGQAFSEEDVPQTTLYSRQSGVQGLSTQVLAGENLENNPASHPLGQKDSSESHSVLKHSKVGYPPPPPAVKEHGKSRRLPTSSKF